MTIVVDWDVKYQTKPHQNRIHVDNTQTEQFKLAMDPPAARQFLEWPFAGGPIVAWLAGNILILSIRVVKLKVFQLTSWKIQNRQETG